MCPSLVLREAWEGCRTLAKACAYKCSSSQPLTTLRHELTATRVTGCVGNNFPSSLSSKVLHTVSSLLAISAVSQSSKSCLKLHHICAVSMEASFPRSLCECPVDMQERERFFNPRPVGAFGRPSLMHLEPTPQHHFTNPHQTLIDGSHIIESICFYECPCQSVPWYLCPCHYHMSPNIFFNEFNTVWV